MGETLPSHFHERFTSLEDATPITARIEDTYQAGSTTTGGWAHVQGLGWASDGTWAITHSQPQSSNQSLLVLCEDPSTNPGDGEGCHHHAIGSDHHGGEATQIVGGVLVTADESGGAALYDIRDPEQPVPLPCELPSWAGGAAGLVWDPSNAVHVASFGGQIFESNGEPLDSPTCSFTPTPTTVEATGEGLSQLYFDPAEDKLVAIGGFRQDKKQHLIYQYFDLDGNVEEAESIEVEGPGFNRGPSLRWAGTLRVAPDEFSLVLGSRGLGAAQGMRIGVYESSVPTNLLQGVYAFAGGLYHGCFPETFHPWGPALHPDNNWAWNWPAGWDSIDAAFFDDGVWTFIKGSQFVTKNHGETAVGNIRPLSELASNWPASWTGVDAAVRHDNGAIYFFRGSTYLRYEPVRNTIGSWYLEAPRAIAGNFSAGWPGWSHVDAAVNGGDGFIYFVRDGQTLAYEMDTAVASMQASSFSCSFGGHADAMTSR